jgi:hypothetical protein
MNAPWQGGNPPRRKLAREVVLLRTACATVLLALAGCATEPPVVTERLAATGIHRDMTVATLVLYHENCKEHRAREGTNCAPGEVTAQINEEAAECLSSAAAGTRHVVTVTPGHVFHERYLASIQPEYEELDEASVLDALQRPAIGGLVAQDGIGYVVTLEVFTRDADRQTTLAAEQGVWGVGRESRRTTMYKATVWGSALRARVGTLALQTQGRTGWVVPVLVVLPLPPVPYWSNTESRACEAMGNALVEFLYSAAAPRS